MLQALAVGAQMKLAHQLRNAEHISQRELERVLKGSLGTSFQVDAYQMEQMINGIMKVGLDCMHVHVCACTFECHRAYTGYGNFSVEIQRNL